MQPRTIHCVVGTRPEAIKMAPLIRAARQAPWACVRVIATGQHRELLDRALESFGVQADHDLDVMRPGQRLVDLTARLMSGLGEVWRRERPDAVLAQGDTTTVLCAALACFYEKIPFGHVEAGLRTESIHDPFPEEANRRLVSQLATWHFCPTPDAHDRLLAEGVAPAQAFMTGNTVIDALLQMRARVPALPFAVRPGREVVLVTAHRRENFGPPLRGIFQAVRELARRRPDLLFVLPVHPNPEVRADAHRLLAGVPGVLLSEPLDYPQLVAVMDRCRFIMTDSGGIQEEAPALGKPVLVLRETTERPEAVRAGVSRLVGTDPSRLVREACTLLDDAQAYAAMARGASPYGDGRASQRIVAVLRRRLGAAEPNRTTQTKRSPEEMAA